MADLTPEVMHELVRLMKGEIELTGLDDDALFALAAAAQAGRETLHDVAAALNARGYTFAQIGERLGVAESTASRWAKPLRDRRWRREQDEPSPDAADEENGE